MRADTGFGVRGMFGPLANVLLVAPEVHFGTMTGRMHLLSAGAVEDIMFTLSL